VRSLNDRLVAVAKAIQADGASKDSIIAVEPRLWITSELPSPIRDFTQIPAGSVVADTFFFSKTIFIIGVGAGSNADGPTLEPGLWRLRGWIRTDMINAASNNLFTQLILQAPIGAALLAVHFNTGALNKMEQQAEDLVRTLPYGRRVTETIQPPTHWRVSFINHLVDRACIGRCFTYSNYEPSFGQFRIRVRPGSPLVTDSPAASSAMESGEYIVRSEDLPLTQIYQCDKTDWTRLCMRDLKAGEVNGAAIAQPTAK